MAASGGLFLVIILLSSLSSKATEDELKEEAFFKRLPTGDVYSHFQFTTQSSINERSGALHFNLFPKSLGQIITKYQVAELHLSLTHGRWKHKSWGYPIIPAPHGAEVWVWFSPSLKPESIDKQWFGLVNALSGQFCASLNYIIKEVSVAPDISFRPVGLWPAKSINESSFLRYATLPRENVCTENLTPWMKLLPCESKAGMSTLFNPLRLYDASYHSLGIHLRSVCKDAQCSKSRLELKQTLSAVYDSYISDVKEGWSFGKLFGEVLKTSCPLATSSRILISIPDNSKHTEMKLDPAPTSFERKTVDGREFKYAVYDLILRNFKGELDVKASFVGLPVVATDRIQPPTIHANRYMTGHGDERGGMVSLISNEHASRAVKIAYLDVIPWYIPVYLHTLKIENNGVKVIPEFFKFVPAKDRIRATKLEVVLSIPPKSTLKLSFSFHRAFLKWTEHPPDSHHGFYYGSAVISMVLPDANNLTGLSERCSTLSGSCIGHSPLFTRIHTGSHLVVIATPDFSMPYNVICLTCTIFAIGFGSMFNLATREFVVTSDKNNPTLKSRVIDFFKRFFKSKSS